MIQKRGIVKPSDRAENAGLTTQEMAKVDSTTIVRFGLFEVDLGRGTLTRQGIRLRIQEQPFRILELLLQQSSEIVTREQLRQALWPEGTHVNFDGSLNAALKKLRAALQDDAENPRFVETVPRQGYRFVAPVHIINEPPSPVLTAEGPDADSDKSVEVRLRLNPYLDDLAPGETHWDQRRAERTQRWFEFPLANRRHSLRFVAALLHCIPGAETQRAARE